MHLSSKAGARAPADDALASTRKQERGAAAASSWWNTSVVSDDRLRDDRSARQ
jgi:hypothetical protein